MLFETEPEVTLTRALLSRRVESLPALPVEAVGPLGDAFLARGAIDLHDAIRVVRDLPFGRNSRPLDPMAVLDDGRGTMSDKHVLLAALMRELGNDEVELVLGMVRMSADTHPSVASALASARLESIPEAMIWLRWYGQDCDFSSMRAGARELVVLQQELIALDQVARYPELRHKDFLLRFLLVSRRDDLPDLKALWSLRERCVDLVLAEEERYRVAEITRAEDIRRAESEARDRALREAQQAAEEAERLRREHAETERARKEAFEAEEAERRARLLEKAKARAAKAEAAAEAAEAAKAPAVEAAEPVPAEPPKKGKRKAADVAAEPEPAAVEPAEPAAPE